MQYERFDYQGRPKGSNHSKCLVDMNFKMVMTHRRNLINDSNKEDKMMYAKVLSEFY